MITSLEEMEKALNKLAGKDEPQKAQMKDVEVVIPTFQEYVPPSKKAEQKRKAEEEAAREQEQRPMTRSELREAKKKAKIDAEFQKDLEKRGFNKNKKKR